MKLKKILILFFILQIIFSFVMKYLSYIGDDSTELHARILQYFTQEDINTGVEYARRGLGARIASTIMDFVILGLFVFTPLAIRIESYLAAKTNQRYYLMITLFVLVFSLIEFIISFPLDLVNNFSIIGENTLS